MQWALYEQKINSETNFKWRMFCSKCILTVFYFQLFFRCNYLLSISTRFFADSSAKGITQLLILRILELRGNVCLRLDVIHYLIKKALIFKTPKYQAFSEIQMWCDFIEPIKLDDIKRGEDLRWPIWTCMIKL